MTTLDGIIKPIAEFEKQWTCDDKRTAFSPDGLLIELADDA